MDDAMIESLDYLHAKAEKKHGLIRSNCEGRGALDSEFDEVKEAMQERKQWKLRAELLDVMNVARRWIEAIDRGGNQ